MKTFFYSKTQEKNNVPVYEVLTSKGWKKFTQTINSEVYKLDGVPDAKVIFIMFGDTDPYIRQNGEIINMELHKCELIWTSEFKDRDNDDFDEFDKDKIFYDKPDGIIESEEVFFKSKNQNKYVKIKFIISRRATYPGYKYIGYAVPIDNNTKGNFDKREICRKHNFETVKETIQNFADEFCILELPQELIKEEELRNRLNLPEDLFESLDKEAKAPTIDTDYPSFLRGFMGNNHPGGIIMIDPSSSNPDGNHISDELKRFLKEILGIDFDD